MVIEEGTAPAQDHQTLTEQPPTRGGERHEPGPTQIGRYLIARKLGQGGMAIVYAAYDPQLDRRVALKLLRGGVKGRSLSVGQARLQREAQTLARLSHPNVVQVYEVGRYGDDVFIAMELVNGKTLRTWLKSQAHDWREILRVFTEAGEGLAAAHAVGIVHRDFKPENVLVGDDGRVRVLDFGLARLEEPDNDERPLTPAEIARGDSPLTRAGVLVGTPAYMAPEQFLRMALTGRTDQFSFCIVLYEALHGQRPFEGTTLESIRENVLLGKIREPPRSGVPSWVRRIVLKGLSVSADDRHPDMRAVLVALARDPAVQRKWWAIAAAVVIAVGGAGALYARTLALQRARCTGADANLAGVWDPPRQQAIEQAMLNTGVPYAPATWTAVKRGLDAYAGRWVAETEAACAATHVRGEASEEFLDLRHGCLNTRLVALRALSDVLSSPGAKTVERAIAAVDALPALAPCSDERYLRARVKPPTEPSVVLQVHGVREQLAAAKAMRDAGDPVGSERQVWDASRAAEAIGYPPLRAEALLSRATLRMDRGDLRGAMSDGTESFHLAGELGDDALVFRAGIVLSQIERSDDRLDQAYAWTRHSEDALRRTGSDPERELELIRARAVIRIEDGHPDLAEPLLLDALDRVQRLPDVDPMLVARLEVDLASCLYNLGRYQPALERLDRARDLLSNLVGVEHPRYADMLNLRAAVVISRGQLDEAHALYEEILAIFQKAFGERHPRVAQTLNNIGYVLLEQRRLDEAAQRFARAYDVLEQVHGDDSPAIVIALTNLARVAAEAGDLEAAAGRFLRAKSIIERHLGATHPELAPIVDGLGALYMREGRLAEAEPLLRRALEITERTDADILRAEGLARLGDLRAKQGRHAEALAFHEQAVALLARELPPDHRYFAASLTGMGEALLALGRPLEALAVLERALKILGADRAARPDELASTRFALARALQATAQEPERARELAEAARRHYQTEPLDAHKLAAVDAWLAAPLRPRRP